MEQLFRLLPDVYRRVVAVLGAGRKGVRTSRAWRSSRSAPNAESGLRPWRQDGTGCPRTLQSTPQDHHPARAPDQLARLYIACCMPIKDVAYLIEGLLDARQGSVVLLLLLTAAAGRRTARRGPGLGPEALQVLERLGQVWYRCKQETRELMNKRGELSWPKGRGRGAR